MAPRKLSAFLFDLDGTLIDTIELIRRSFDHTLAAHGLSPESAAGWLDGLGRPLEWQFARYVRGDAAVAEMVRTYRAFNEEHHDALVRPYGGALEAVLELRDAGGRLAVVTSKRRESALRGLARCGFGEVFDVLVCADDVKVHKPAPDPVLRALELLGAPAVESVYVGDSYHDLRAGRAAGTRTAAVAWGPFPREELERERPDLWLESPADIARLAGCRRPG